MDMQELFLQSPYLNAAGSLGFTPDLHGNRSQSSGLNRLGAFITNPISLAPRQPAASRTCLPYEGGFLLHSGLVNPGLRAALRQFTERWSSSPLAVIPHLIANSADEMERLVRPFEGMENIAGVEIGLPEGIDHRLAVELAGKAAGELSVIACLPFADAILLGKQLKNTPVAAVSLGPPRGLLLGNDGKLVEGRLYGPGILPTALKVVEALAGQGWKVFGAGGIYNKQDAAAMMAAGASGVQLDAVLWGVEGINILAEW